LNYLRAGEGYMYYSGAATGKSFNYPSAAASQLKSATTIVETAVENRWTTNVYKYPNTMTVTSVVLQDNEELKNGIIEIAAFAGNECRGSILLQNVPQIIEHPLMGFLLVFGEDGENISFKVYNHDTGIEYTALQQMNFAVNAMYGTFDNPFKISFNATGIPEVNKDAVRLYPNPVKDILYIGYVAEKIDRLKISDVSGKVILTKQDFSEKSINLTNLAEGVYFVDITINEQTTIHKFVKK